MYINIIIFFKKTIMLIYDIVDSNILVLTSGSWPLSNSNITFQIPVELEDNINQFTEFYQKEHNGRKLTWLYQLSKADVRLYTESKRYELNMTLYQVAILLLFNSGDSFTINEIINQTQLPLNEVSRFLKVINYNNEHNKIINDF